MQLINMHGRGCLDWNDSSQRFRYKVCFKPCMLRDIVIIIIIFILGSQADERARTAAMAMRRDEHNVSTGVLNH